jgi:GT2 family glycosyltransferase
LKESDIHVLISVPTKDNVSAPTCGWLLETVKQATLIGYKIGVHFVYSPYPIEIQRNNQVANFLEDERFTHLFFLDSDCVPPPLTIEKLLDYDLDIVASCAPALIAGNHVFTSACWLPPDERKDPKEKYRMPLVSDENAKGLKEVDVVGMTGVLVKRQVFETLEKPWFKMVFNEDHTGLELGEDYYFCEKAREAGYKVWVDYDVRQQHLKVVPL